MSVFLAKQDTYEPESLRASLDAAFSAFGFYEKLTPGARVILKPNLIMPSAPEKAAVTHPEIKRLILQHYPKARVILLNEIGSAGPWPGPGVIRAQKDEFMGKLKQMHVDAVIAGNGGCGLCTPKEMGSCIAAEYSGPRGGRVRSARGRISGSFYISYF